MHRRRGGEDADGEVIAAIIPVTPEVRALEKKASAEQNRCQTALTGQNIAARRFDGRHVSEQNPCLRGIRQRPPPRTRMPRMLVADDSPDDGDSEMRDILSRLGAGHVAARDSLMGFACERMRGIARRMLRTFPTVRRWDETDDIVQNAAMRLYRALSQTTPLDTRGLIGLAALQVRRELLDLARKHAGPESYGANHETNVRRVDGHETPKIEMAKEVADPADHLDRWTRLHEAAEALPAEEREVFHFVWYMGLKQEEIASLIGCSVRTVKRRWESAKSLIKAAVEGEPPQ